MSQIDDVKVELVAKQTSPGTSSTRRGFVTWSVSLKRGECENTDLAYTIHLPDAWQVTR